MYFVVLKRKKMEISQAIEMATGGIGGHHLFNKPLIVEYIRPKSQGRPVVAEVISVASHKYKVVQSRAGKFEIRIAGASATIWVEPAKIKFLPQPE